MKQFLLMVIFLLAACSTKPEERLTVEVLSYAGNLPITEEGSWKIEWPGGPTSKWTTQVMGDTVVVKRSGLCGDECVELHQLEFIDQGTSFPQFSSYTYTEDHFFPQKMTITDRLTSGTVEIQDWDMNGVVSGQVSGRWLLNDRRPITFWVDLVAEKTWVTIDPIQCLGNPWEQDWLLTHEYDEYPRDVEDQMAILRAFFQDQGVAIYETKVSRWAEGVCAACSCPTGDRIHCLIDETDLPAMLEWGFVEAG